jgi:hypothetical protein
MCKKTKKRALFPFCQRWGGDSLSPNPTHHPQVLETRVDSPEIIACLKGLSDFYDDNTPAARRGACQVPDKVEK